MAASSMSWLCWFDGPKTKKKKPPAVPQTAMSLGAAPMPTPTPHAGRSRGVGPGDGPQLLFTSAKGQQDKLVGVVVTIFQGSSYDENFRTVEPTTVPGERVSTWSLQCCDVGRLRELLEGAQQPPAAPSSWAQLLEDIRSVPADGVTLNWECCSECGDQGFPHGRGLYAGGPPQRRGWGPAHGPSATMQLAGLAVRRGFTAMFSDFSLKALICEWSEEQLGPNPFAKLPQVCDEQMMLEFLPSDLRGEEVPQQLQVVGELCAEQGRAAVAALGDTILYTLNPRRAQTELYDVRVLTVVSDVAGGLSMPEAMKCSVGSGPHERRGAAGHVTLTYASGGQLVTSAGHWIELSRLDTTEEQVIRVAARNFGEAARGQLEEEMSQLSTAKERFDCAQKWSKSMVQQSVPTRMKARTKF